MKLCLCFFRPRGYGCKIWSLERRELRCPLDNTPPS